MPATLISNPRRRRCLLSRPPSAMGKWWSTPHTKSEPALHSPSLLEAKRTPKKRTRENVQEPPSPPRHRWPKRRQYGSDPILRPMPDVALIARPKPLSLMQAFCRLWISTPKAKTASSPVLLQDSTSNQKSCDSTEKTTMQSLLLQDSTSNQKSCDSTEKTTMQSLLLQDSTSNQKFCNPTKKMRMRESDGLSNKTTRDSMLPDSCNATMESLLLKDAPSNCNATNKTPIESMLPHAPSNQTSCNAGRLVPTEKIRESEWLQASSSHQERYKEDVLVEQKGGGLVISFICRCGKPQEILLSDNKFYSQLALVPTEHCIWFENIPGGGSIHLKCLCCSKNYEILVMHNKVYYMLTSL